MGYDNGDPVIDDVQVGGTRQPIMDHHKVSARPIDSQHKVPVCTEQWSNSAGRRNDKWSYERRTYDAKIKLDERKPVSCSVHRQLYIYLVQLRL